MLAYLVQPSETSAVISVSDVLGKLVSLVLHEHGR